MSFQFCAGVFDLKFRRLLVCPFWNVLSMPCGIPEGVRKAKFYRASVAKIGKLVLLRRTQTVPIKTQTAGLITLYFYPKLSDRDARDTVCHA